MPMARQQIYELPLIPTISPSLAETLRSCPLQAGISRIKAVRSYVLGNPKAWLGTAYHQVLEQVWGLEPFDLESRIEELWLNAIKKLQVQAEAHPLNRRFANPEQWQGYHLVRAFTLLRAKQALHFQPREPVARAPTAPVFREQQFSAMNGKLIGRPDVILGNEIRDYKSGRIYDEAPDGNQTVKQAYVRQLRLYGRLVQEQLALCPSRGVLLPMDGDAVEVPLDPQACATEANEAVGLLDTYNDQIQSSSTAADLATPSPHACRWCQYKALCPAFWEHVNATWMEGLRNSCVRGTLVCAPRTIHNDKALSITLASMAGTTTGLLTISPLEASIHSNVASWQSGDVVCVVNLYRRNDGQLAPTPATVCVRELDSVTFGVTTATAERTIRCSRG